MPFLEAATSPHDTTSLHNTTSPEDNTLAQDNTLLQDTTNASCSAYSEQFLISLSQQPAEIIALVLSWLDFKDVLNLRITNHFLHELVHKHQRALCSELCNRLQQRSPAIYLAPQIHGSNKNMLYYVKLSQRHRWISNLAALLADYLVQKMKQADTLVNSEKADIWYRGKSRLLTRRLLPALFLYNTFLERLRRVFIDGEECMSSIPGKRDLELREMYLVDQQLIIERLEHCDEIMMCDITHTAVIINWIYRSIEIPNGHRFSRSAQPIDPDITCKRMLVMHGLLPFASLLRQTMSSPDRTDRKQDIAMPLYSVEWIWNQYENLAPHPVPVCVSLHSIHHIRDIPHYLPQKRVFSTSGKLRSRSRLVKFMNEQDIWFKAAGLVAQRRSLDLCPTPSPTPTIAVSGSWSMRYRQETDQATQHFENIIRVDGDPRFELVL